jgi:hypothetical protein
MSSNQIRVIVGVIQAVIAFALVTQSDVVIPPLIKFALGAITVGLAAIDWGALGEPTKVQVTGTVKTDDK